MAYIKDVDLEVVTAKGDVLVLYYRPQRKCEGYVFTGVCLSTGGWGCLPQCMLGYYTPPGADTPRSDTPQSRHPLAADTPLEQTPSPREQTPPGADTPQEQTPPGSRHLLGADPPEQTPPRSRHTLSWSRHPPGTDTPQEQTPPIADTPWEADTPWGADTHPQSIHPPRSRPPPTPEIQSLLRTVCILLECILVPVEELKWKRSSLSTPTILMLIVCCNLLPN